MTAETERREIRETFEDETLLALKMEEGTMNQGLQTASTLPVDGGAHSFFSHSRLGPRGS